MTSGMPPKTTPLQRWHLANGAKLEQGLVMTTPSDPELGLVDLTALPRLGFKGADTVAWLQQQGWLVPDSPNKATLNKGVVTLRLSSTECFLASITTESTHELERLRGQWSMDLSERVYLLEREHSHACFAICGAATPSMLAKLCAVDLRDHRFEALSVAQTSVARSTAIVTRLHADDEPHFLLCADITGSAYLWECLLDAMHEYSGGHLAYPSYLEKQT